ncbi:MAG: nicotinamide riboside transporter PnuC [Bacteroidota bacterium]
MQEWIDVFWLQVSQTSPLEALAVGFGLTSVWCSKQESLWVYPTGIVSVLIYIYLTFDFGIYADTGINGYYLIMSIYGWYHWTDTQQGPQIPITSTNGQEKGIAIALIITSYLIIRFGLSYTDSTVPNWDAATTSIAISGMWLMARKKIENWLAWIVADAISVPLYWYKGLPLTSIQFLIFTALATWGYFSWKRNLDLAMNKRP